jgi:hypothetical protein
MHHSCVTSGCAQKEHPYLPPYNGRLSDYYVYLTTVICSALSEERNLLCVRAHNAEGPPSFL